ncbi:hypothetical protein [Oxalicibacterium solurbis]|uniref:DUF2486 family protein n=1 Tax=Oxalicibacterium solurbis TaxID=69280 RepID=A0A8J3AVA8_9BURK|nr:hypothetical protein [Oxalicibacterium solurbis]GGI53587.1 hypothetical protein GCM10011430_07610 [Oxalicibacterium solurbis]
MNKSAQDAGIPMLTEVIQPPPAPAEPEPPVVVAAAVPLDEHEPPVSTQPIDPEPIDGWLDEEWTRLEQKVAARTLAQLQERIDPVMEQQIADSVAVAVETALADMQRHLRRQLQQTLEQLVREAVAEEIENMRFSKN